MVWSFVGKPPCAVLGGYVAHWYTLVVAAAATCRAPGLAHHAVVVEQELAVHSGWHVALAIVPLWLGALL